MRAIPLCRTSSLCLDVGMMEDEWKVDKRGEKVLGSRLFCGALFFESRR